MPKNVPSVTLTDPKTKQSASLDDDAAVRKLMLDLVGRIHREGTWKERLPEDSTERVAAQILRKVGDGKKALAIIRDAGSIAAVFADTDLSDDALRVPTPKSSERKPGLLDDKACEKLVEDVAEAVRLLWPTYRAAIERGEGSEKQTAKITAEFVPESENADAFIKVVAETRVSTTEITRTSKVRKLKGGRFQLELYA